MHGLRRRNFRIALALFALPLTAFPRIASAGSVVQTEQVRAELLAHAPEGIAPGQDRLVRARARSTSRTGTPTGRTPATPGLPTTLNWTLPAGATAGDIDWPTPRRLPIGPLLNFGYEGTVLLPVPVTITGPVAGNAMHVRLEADWLVCKIECIPQSGTFELNVANAISGRRCTP